MEDMLKEVRNSWNETSDSSWYQLLRKRYENITELLSEISYYNTEANR